MMRASETGADGSVRAVGADPAEVPFDQTWLIGSEAEIAVAVADFDCRQETDFMDTYVGRVRAMQQDLIDEYGAALEQFKAAASELAL
jgi:hypothetical protein